MTDGILRSVTHYRTGTRAPFPMPAAPPAQPPLDDAPNAIAAFSFRKLRAAYAGSAVRLRRSSDSTEQDIGFSGDDFDSASAAAFVGAGSGFVTTWYDQSGNSNDATQSTVGNQPQWTTQDSLNWASFDGTNDILITPTIDMGPGMVSTLVWGFYNNSSGLGIITEHSDNYNGYDGGQIFYSGDSATNLLYGLLTGGTVLVCGCQSIVVGTTTTGACGGGAILD